MKTIYTVITSNGDGSSTIQWVVDPIVIDKMQELADDGNECYASGDGLQVRNLYFPDNFDLDGWLKMNYIRVTTLEDI